MRNLLDFLSAHYHWLVFVILEAIGVSLLVRYNSYQSSVWISSANTAVGMVYDMESKVQAFFSLTRNNEELSRRNVYLEHQVNALTEQLQKANMDSTDIAALKSIEPNKYIAAKVVHNSLNLKDNLITINRGTEDGVGVDMGVISGHGVVGIVYQAGPHYSVVIPILSSLSSISCKVEGTNYFGRLSWTGKERNMAYVDDIPRHARFRLYQRVVTSGFSSVFPEGVAVGKIIHVYNSPDGVSYRLQVQLYTDFGNLRDVFVFDNSNMQEQLQTLKAAEDSLRNKTE